jgi:hypothetical protein
VGNRRDERATRAKIFWLWRVDFRTYLTLKFNGRCGGCGARFWRATREALAHPVSILLCLFGQRDGDVQSATEAVLPFSAAGCSLEIEGNAEHDA